MVPIRQGSGFNSLVRAHIRINQWIISKWNNKSLFFSLSPPPLSSSLKLIKKHTHTKTLLSYVTWGKPLVFCLGFHFWKSSIGRLGHSQANLLCHQAASRATPSSAAGSGQTEKVSRRLLSQILVGDPMPLTLDFLVISPLAHVSTRVWGQRQSSPTQSSSSETLRIHILQNTSKDRQHH